MMKMLYTLTQAELNDYYYHLTADTIPSGSYDGFAWSKTLPINFLNRFWKGKVFTGHTVRNKIIGRQLVEGVVSLVGVEILIDYPQLRVQDRLRQITTSPEMYLGRMNLRSHDINFTLTRSVE